MILYRPRILPFLRSLILAVGTVAFGLLGGFASGQSTPTGFSLVPRGSFTMGRTSGDTDSNAPPITVTVSSFYIQQTETTKAQWDEVRTWGLNNGYTDLAAGGGKTSNHPVQTVSWWDVVKWCNARSEIENLTPVYTVGGAVMKTGTTTPEVNWAANGYRLPTEAEWEKAARSGVEGKRFPWGADTISHVEANFRNIGGEAYANGTTGHHPSYTAGGLPYTSPVGSFEANGYGLYDMAGNVWEWCWDWVGSSYYTTSNGTTDPRGPASGTSRVHRGGGWWDDASLARCATRSGNPPDFPFSSLGFRPARSHVVAGMSLIPGGSFTMGRTSGDTDSNAPPITVTVSPFYIQQTETTKAQWDEVRTWGLNNGYTDLAAGGGKESNHPVQTASWWDVVKWCNARSEKEGLTPVYSVGGVVMKIGTEEPQANWSADGYRLPTEAEWEKAARGGIQGHRYPWGDEINHDHANFRANGGEFPYDTSPYSSLTYHPSYSGGAAPYTSPVGSFPGNGFGLHDMAGNVWEWCWDWHGQNWYVDGAVDPRGPSSGTNRVRRGGSWFEKADQARTANRNGYGPPAFAPNDLGFRCARTVGMAATSPELDSPSVNSVTGTAANLGGNVTSDGGAAITERGVVYSATATNSNPLIGGTGVTKATATGTTGVFTAAVTGLVQGTGYSFKAYATNSAGTSYTSAAAFLTSSNNANLVGLVLDGFSFSPSFSGATTTYMATVQRADGSVKIRPSAAHVGASLFVRINDGGWVPLGSGALSLPLALEIGDNLVEVRVIAQDGATDRTYSLEVFRNDPKPDAMVGQSLAFMGGANVYEYALAQQLQLTSRAARPVIGYVRAVNRGNVADRIALQGSGGSRFFGVDYRDSNGSLVTVSVRAGLHRTHEQNPGDSGDWLRVDVRPVKKLLAVKKRKRTLTLRKVQTLLIQASSFLDPSVGDGVSIRVETR